MGTSYSKGSSSTTMRAVLRRVFRRVLRGGRTPKKVSPSGPPTAQSQTSVASAAATNPYFDVETLLASVESGAIAAVKGTWLVGLHKRGGRLSRRQDLPPEAFWSAGELRRVARALGDDFGVLFVALSYRWLTKEHPDPDGFHLGIVASVAELYLNPRGWKDIGGRDQTSQLTAAFRNHGLGLPEFALFWDFASLHQPPKTDAEAKLFRMGLDNSNVWYGHVCTVVWMQSELPEGFAARMRASEPPLAETYEDSGWCYVEAAISAAIKPGFLRLDLAKRTERAMACAYGPGVPGDEADNMLARVCARRRPPPPSPETVRRLLQTEKRFTNKSDVSKVADLYATFFGKVTNVGELKFQGLEWGDADVVELCEVLPRFAALRTLDLSRNKIGPAGASALGEVLKVNAVLTILELSLNKIGAEGAIAIAEALKVNAVVTTLSLWNNSIGDEGAIVIAEALKVNAVLTVLDLRVNKIGAEGAIAIAEALKVNAVLTILDLRVNKIGAEGAIVIMEALKVNAVLTELHLAQNKIGAEGAIAIAEVLKVNSVVTTLGLEDNNVGAEGAKAIAEALKVNAVLTILDLRFNKTGAEGAIAIAEALKVNTVLTKLRLGVNTIGDEGAKAIAEALNVNTVVTELSLGSNIGPEGAIAIAEALKVNAMVTTLYLGGNSIGDEGAKAIAEALKVNAVLTSLELSGNNIGAEGAIAITEVLKVNAVLTNLNLEYNSNMGDAGKKAVRDAVENRSGLVLEM
jgi:Ran GTPase-activating protein (RanGAP) involved in mRNA processing and transport